MVRSTAAEVVKKFGGTYPAGWDATKVGYICQQACYALDGKTHPNTLSSTDTQVIELENELAYRMLLHGIWATGPIFHGAPEPVVWTQDMIERLDRLSTDTGFKGFSASPMQEES